MKKNYYPWLFAALALLYTSCNSCNKSDTEKEKTKVEYHRYEGVQTYTIASTDTMIEINGPEFEKIVEYILTEGYLITERGVASDKEYIFYDSSDNKHILRATRRDQDNLPSTKAPVTQISVWVNSRDSKQGKEIFYYIICPHYIVMPKTGIKHLGEIQKAYEGMLRLSVKE